MSLDLSNLSVQSYCFRGFKDNAKVIEMTKAIGVNGIEICGVHCDFNNEALHQPTIDLYRNAGLRVVSIGVETFSPDEAHARKRFEFARKAGCKVISANFRPATFLATLPVVYKLCQEYGINLAIHNHGGYHWLGSAEILDWVFSITRCCIGLNMDTAWALDARQDPVKWADQFAQRLYAVHLKDFVFDRARKGSDVIVGTGNVNLPALFKALEAKGFKGELIVEYEADVNNPVPALTECVKAIRAAGK